MTAEQLAKILLQNIFDINIGNLLKIQSYFRLKETDKNVVEIEDFFNAILDLCASLYNTDNGTIYAEIVLATIKAQEAIAENKNINKAHLLDCYLLCLKSISE